MRPGVYTGGNSASLREDADMLDSYAEAMATSYIAKTGGDKAEILALLQDGKDHWYTAEEAICRQIRRCRHRCPAAGCLGQPQPIHPGAVCIFPAASKPCGICRATTHHHPEGECRATTT